MLKIKPGQPQRRELDREQDKIINPFFGHPFDNDKGCAFGPIVRRARDRDFAEFGFWVRGDTGIKSAEWFVIKIDVVTGGDIKSTFDARAQPVGGQLGKEIGLEPGLPGLKSGNNPIVLKEPVDECAAAALFLDGGDVLVSEELPWRRIEIGMQGEELPIKLVEVVVRTQAHFGIKQRRQSIVITLLLPIMIGQGEKVVALGIVGKPAFEHLGGQIAHPLWEPNRG